MFQIRQARSWTIVVLLSFIASTATAAPAESVEIYSAGSLRGVVSDLAREASTTLNIEVKASFGGSGALRKRIEKGASPDLFLSADLASPRKLATQGRAVLPAVPFARNRMCIVSRRSMGLTSANLIDRLLEKGVRIKTSTPVEDPSGDYAWAIFDRIEQLRPGSAAILKDKARASMALKATPATPAQSAAAALFASHQVDVSITYCSGSGNLERELPELTSLVVPPALDPHPVYGMAILSNRSEALRVALYLLSDKGQAIVGKAGLVPLTEQPGVSP
jgi:molybdate transport system substrate-binding protein